VIITEILLLEETTKQKKDEVLVKVPLHFGMRLQVVTPQSKKIILDQQIADRLAAAVFPKRMRV